MLNDKLNQLQSENDKLLQKVINIEAKSLRNNLLLIGVKEQPWEKDDSFWENMMGVVEKMGIHREEITETIHCKCMKGKNSDPSPIIIKFQFYSMREIVWNECFVLKDIPTAKHWFLDEAFPVEIENKRKKLYPMLKAAKKTGKKPLSKWITL